MTRPDLDAARREAEEALATWAYLRRYGTIDILCTVIERLLAATAPAPVSERDAHIDEIASREVFRG